MALPPPRRLVISAPLEALTNHAFPSALSPKPRDFGLGALVHGREGSDSSRWAMVDPTLRNLPLSVWLAQRSSRVPQTLFFQKVALGDD